MTINILKPPGPHYQPLTLPRRPAIFTAGPIQGVGDWQEECSSKLVTIGDREKKDFMVFNPRQPVRTLDDFKDTDYYAQVDWEHHHIEYALACGVILFWCPTPDFEVQGRAYAQTTRFEMGWVLGIAQVRSYTRVVVGIDSKFSNYRYLKHTVNLISSKNSNVYFCETFDETCEQAVKIV